LGNGNHRKRDKREMQRSSFQEQKTLHEEDGSVTIILMRREVVVRSRDKSIADASANQTEVKYLFIISKQ
jgi:hypothetical protein